MKRVVFVTGHYWNSKRRAGFHWLAEAYWSRGWEVLFLTTSLSLLSIPRRDHRLQYGLLKEINRLRQPKPNLWSYVTFTSFHPANLRLPGLNHIFSPIFEQYDNQVNLHPCLNWLEKADLFIFESTAGLMLIDQMKIFNSHAKYVYRVSDDLHCLQSHPVLIKQEASKLDCFDLVSTPSPSIYKRLLAKNHAVKLEYHALRKDLFDQPYNNPYQGKGPNVIFSGIAYFDTQFLEIASRNLPNWQFHIIGPIHHLPQRPNIWVYGECRFVSTIPYLKHADLGLQTLTYRPGAESFTHSLKTIQYTYCQLPIVAPNYLTSNLSHWYTYESSAEDSIVDALQQAVRHPRSEISTAGILSWDELVERWCEQLKF